MNKRRQDIICLAFPFWEGEYAKSTVQLMSILAKDYRILYVDYQCTIKDLISGCLGDSSIPIKRILGLNKRLRELKTRNGESIFVFTPWPIIPINWLNNQKIYNFCLKVNNWIIRKSTSAAIRKLKITEPIVVNAYNPFYGLYNVKKFKEKKLIYYCYDEISGSPWAGKHGKRVENEFLEKVDTVITSSSELYYEKSLKQANCFIVKNGVDFQFFNSKISNSISSGKTKTIGYIGSVDERLDYELLSYVIQNFPEVKFRFIGRIVFPELIEPLKNHKNVFLEGPINYEKIPEMISQFDIGLIPFLKNDYTKRIYPLKINEYLALGKPVIMTDFANLDEFRNIVHVCNSKEKYIQALNDELSRIGKNKVEIVENRIKVAYSNSWERRAEDFSKIIEL